MVKPPADGSDPNSHPNAGEFGGTGDRAERPFPPEDIEGSETAGPSDPRAEDVGYAPATSFADPEKPDTPRISRYSKTNLAGAKGVALQDQHGRPVDGADFLGNLKEADLSANPDESPHGKMRGSRISAGAMTALSKASRATRKPKIEPVPVVSTRRQINAAVPTRAVKRFIRGSNIIHR